jgi:LacI family transcriptional regulator
VIDQAPRIGYEAARWLDVLMQGRPLEEPGRRLLIPPAGVATRRSTETTAISDPLVARAARQIRERACEGLTVPELLKELRISRTSFYDRFHEELGRSPHQEILRVKLDRVRQLLTQTTQSLEQIAATAGFKHAEYLQVAFKREVGMTPGKYRRSH